MVVISLVFITWAAVAAAILYLAPSKLAVLFVIVWLFFGFPIVVFLKEYLEAKSEEYKKKTTLCPHGVPGGKTFLKCQACVSEKAEMDRTFGSLSMAKKSLEQTNKALQEVENQTAEKLEALAKMETDFNKMVSEKSKTMPWVANMFADYQKTLGNNDAKYLETKSRPALKSAEMVRKISQEKSEAIAEQKKAQYLLSYYESMFPWLAELRDNPPHTLSNAKYDKAPSEALSEDDASKWLTAEEYSSLPSNQKYQLALDRYWNRKKSNWEIGRDFERYIGYKYEKEGYSVFYQGIIDGLEDLGRDLICQKNGAIYIVQCKYWSTNKTIHEKHVNQLFGTSVMYFLQNKRKMESIADFNNCLKQGKIVPTFITSTSLSQTAMSFANALGVQVKQNVKIEPYPLIKCNISKRTGEKIYHLPFDQQYDKVKIDSTGEFFAFTVKEAEDKGFRRAFRWRPE